VYLTVPPLRSWLDPYLGTGTISMLMQVMITLEKDLKW